MGAVAAQAVGGAGVIPFQAASHEIIFDAFTSDSFTSAAATVNLFNGNLGAIKPYGYLANLWIKIAMSGGTAGAGVLAADSPYNAFQTFRFLDPNGHAIIDTDGYGLYLLNKYGARYWGGDPAKLPNAVVNGVITSQYDYLIPLQINAELGIGAIPNMDSSGPYRIQAVGNTQAAMYSTPPTASPLVTLTVGGEFLSLPDRASRVNGSPQMIAPPGLDKGFAIVGEYTKQSFTPLVTGNQTIRLTRVGNIIRQLFLVVRNSAGARIAWTGGTAVTAGSLIQFSFDTVPLWQADPQHILDQMARRRDLAQVIGTGTLDLGVLVVDFAAPTELSIGSLGVDGGFDQMIQTAQSSALELSFTWAAGANGGTLEVYTSDVTITSLSGQPYSFAFAGQLLAPAQASMRS